jgi:hypothetical protein
MRRIVILGMGRSGTTYLTELLDKCGVYVDTVNWAHEHDLARIINDTLLEREFGARPGLPYGNLPDEEINPSEYWRTLARMYVDYMSGMAEKAGAASWTFKDPRTTVLGPMWLPHFDVVLGMFRTPQEVMDSYTGQKWVTGWGAKKTVLGYWKRFNRSLLTIYKQNQGVKPTFLLDYNQDHGAQAAVLCEKLGLPLTDEARNLYKLSLKHYTAENFPADPEAAEIYRGLREARILQT